MTSKAPDLRTLAHDGISEEKTEFTFLLVGIIQKLWKQQVWCDGDISLFHCKAAVGFGGSYVLSMSPAKGEQIYTIGLKARSAWVSLSIEESAL